jgi:NAD(P)-dependent dehydrogenase (short-subunit alcohol dehydrogenase family)
MDLKIGGKTAFITGGGGGVGRAVALAFAREGVSVAVVDLSEENALKAAEEVQAAGGRAIGLKVDVTQWGDVDSAVRRTVEQFGGVDILVNGAGVRAVASLEETTDEVFDLHVDVNLRGPFYTCKAVVPLMKERRWGRIVNIASAAGRRGHPFAGSTYAAAKAGVFGLTKSIARETASYGITANTIAPNTINTPFIDAFTPEQREAVRKSIPLGRLAEPEDLVGPILLLASEAGSFITGQDITVDGGQLML